MSEEIARLRGRARSRAAAAQEGLVGGGIDGTAGPLLADDASWVDKYAPVVEARALAALCKRDRVSY